MGDEHGAGRDTDRDVEARTRHPALPRRLRPAVQEADAESAPGTARRQCKDVDLVRDLRRRGHGQRGPDVLTGGSLHGSLRHAAGCRGQRHDQYRNSDGPSSSMWHGLETDASTRHGTSVVVLSQMMPMPASVPLVDSRENMASLASFGSVRSFGIRCPLPRFGRRSAALAAFQDTALHGVDPSLATEFNRALRARRAEARRRSELLLAVPLSG